MKGGTKMLRLKIQEAIKENLKGLGQLIKIPVEGERKADSESPIHKFYGRLGVINFNGEYEFGICSFKKREMVTKQLEQHVTTSELLFALNSDFVTPLAPVIKRDGKDYPDFDKMIAIIIRENSGIILEKGIFHFALWPMNDNSSALIGFQKGVVEGDIIITELKEEIELFF